MALSLHLFHHDLCSPQQLARIEIQLAAILTEMRNMTDVVKELETKVDAFGVLVNNIVDELYEIKAALDSALLTGNTARLQAVSDKVGTLHAKLKDAGTAVDITPETPVEPPPPPPEPTPEPTP